MGILTQSDELQHDLLTAEGDVTQPLQWSSEYADLELGLVYYNYRYYNPTDGRWNRRDPIGISSALSLYSFVSNAVEQHVDILGLEEYFACNKRNVGRFKDLRVVISVESMMSSYVVADTDDATIKQIFTQAVRKKEEEVLDGYLRESFSVYRRFQKLLEAIDQYRKGITKKFNPDLLAELLSSAGGIIRLVTVAVSASFCCCNGGKFTFRKASDTESVDVGPIKINPPEEKDLKKLQKLPDYVARISFQAVRKVQSDKCK